MNEPINYILEEALVERELLYCANELYLIDREIKEKVNGVNGNEMNGNEMNGNEMNGVNENEMNGNELTDKYEQLCRQYDELSNKMITYRIDFKAFECKYCRKDISSYMCYCPDSIYYQVLLKLPEEEFQKVLKEHGVNGQSRKTILG